MEMTKTKLRLNALKERGELTLRLVESTSDDLRNELRGEFVSTDNLLKIASNLVKHTATLKAIHAEVMALRNVIDEQEVNNGC